MLPAKLQRSTRNTHMNNMEDVVSACFKETPNRFWSFLKSKRQEASGVSELAKRDAFLQSNTTAKAEF